MFVPGKPFLISVLKHKHDRLVPYSQQGEAAVREKTIAYYIAILITIVEGFMAPCANVIKLFKAISYFFS